MNLDWLQDRRDPRSIFATSLAVAVLGIPGAILVLTRDTVATAYIAIWLVVVVGQLVWATLKFRRYLASRS